MKKIQRIAALFMAAIVLSSCSLPGLGSGFNEEGITITGGSTTEQQIIGYIVEGMIEHYIDIDAQIVNNLGSSSLNHQALVGGDANVAAIKYTGTSLTGELGRDPITDPEKALELVVDGFAAEFNQKWFPTYGFANTYAFMVTQELADQYNLVTISDLEDVAGELNAGVDSSWIQREGDGYAAFLDTYGFDFNRVYPMQIGLVYNALQAGEMDVVLGYSTDGRIKSYDLVVLEDDKQLFPPYDASPVATFEVLEAYPELNKVLSKLQNSITDEKMQELNYISDNNLIEPKVVADDFLKENNYFESVEVNEGGGE
ncbi:osmoprotectant ABC transporter substrate-binding protein [Carnobacterium inhibens]|uniref:Glycine/betaine ABC transporter substrate-binding protein n=1 Tax=Carnobacterium inhibens subsp. gilichinskyi TaxID=1266845 RepID=U5SBN0_9LACT|nr:osmoprotectant ABC transporter substrate-binding protein [Carnobacterium inhibens]AGY81513.1 glycine/betaine ABC transporter substrate-binding protein [Carnobacterium inhibens subsp. gilichinskyi]